MNRWWDFQGVEEGLFIQFTTEAESDSIKNFFPKKSSIEEDNSIAFTTTSSSASLAFLVSTDFPLHNDFLIPLQYV